MTGPAMPNFCRWLNQRFGRGWTVRRGSVSREAFLAAKSEYERAIGCRVYSAEYRRRFQAGGGGGIVEVVARDLYPRLPPPAGT